VLQAANDDIAAGSTSLEVQADSPIPPGARVALYIIPKTIGVSPTY
jgi:hypothetical protein